MVDENVSMTELGWREHDQIPELFVKCHCAAEALEISYYSEKNNGENMFHVVFWDTGRKKVSSISWKEKWGLIWKIIRGENLEADGVYLDHKRAKQTADFIYGILEKDTTAS
jgi:hypothetical protein